MFIKECKAISKSIIYFAFLTVIVLFYVTQLGNYAGNDIKQYKANEIESGEPSGNPLVMPIPGRDSYGYRNAEIPTMVMPNAIAGLVAEYMENGFASYSTGFYKKVKLGEKQLAEVESMLMEMTGLSADDLLSRRNEKVTAYSALAFGLGMKIDYSDVIPIIVDYNDFKKNMGYINKLIGGGSSYDPLNLKQYGQVAVSYEEKLAEYNDFLNKDRITGAYARLFCDYMGIVVALFSVFVPVSFLLRDKRAKMNELIYSRGRSSASIVLTRYAALVCVTILPFLLLSLLPTVQLSILAVQNGWSADYFAFIKYITAWIMPTVLAITAVAYFLTTLTDSPIAILFQFVWSIFGVLTSANSLEGGRYGFEIAIRHNSLGNLYLLQENINALILNRVVYSVISIILVFAAIHLYSFKRRGQLNVFGKFKKFILNR